MGPVRRPPRRRVMDAYCAVGWTGGGGRRALAAGVLLQTLEREWRDARNLL